MTANTEPVATPIACEHGQLARVCEICELKLELDAERERADEAEKREMSRYQQYSALLERHEKQTAELAALKEALQNPTDDMVSSGLITARETGEITEVFKAMTANLLKD